MCGAERRPDLRADDEIEQLIASGVARVCRVESQHLRGALQFADVRVERIESRMAAHGFAIAHELHRQLRCPSSCARELRDFAHQILEREARADTTRAS